MPFACPACPAPLALPRLPRRFGKSYWGLPRLVAPADGTGVGPEDRIGVKSRGAIYLGRSPWKYRDRAGRSYWGLPRLVAPADGTGVAPADGTGV